MNAVGDKKKKPGNHVITGLFDVCYRMGESPFPDCVDSFIFGLREISHNLHISSIAARRWTVEACKDVDYNIASVLFSFTSAYAYTSFDIIFDGK